MTDKPDYAALLAIDAAFTQEEEARRSMRELLCTDPGCWSTFPFKKGGGLRPYIEARRLGWRERGSVQGSVWFCPEHPPPAIVKH